MPAWSSAPDIDEEDLGGAMTVDLDDEEQLL